MDLSHHQLQPASWDPRDVLQPTQQLSDEIHGDLSDDNQSTGIDSQYYSSILSDVSFTVPGAGDGTNVVETSPIQVDMFPPEILVLVFQSAIKLLEHSELRPLPSKDPRVSAKTLDEEYLRRQWSATRCAVRISQVSRKWREIALKTPSLWTRIWICGRVSPRLIAMGPFRVKAFAERSNSNPLNLVFDDAGDQVLRYVSKYASMIRSLTILESNSSGLGVLQGLSLLQLPQLREMHLEVKSWGSSHPFMGRQRTMYPYFTFGSFAPSLQKATFIGILPRNNPTNEPTGPEPLPQLSPIRSLVVRVRDIHLYHLEDALKICVDLEDLKLEDTGFSFIPDLQTPGSPINLPSLRSLEINFDSPKLVKNILARWVAPQLRYLRMKTTSVHDPSLRPKSHIIPSPLLHPLRELRISGLGSHKALVGSLFTSVPALETLAIQDTASNMSKTVSLMDGKGLNSLRSSSSTRSPYTLPFRSLVSLSIETSRDMPVVTLLRASSTMMNVDLKSHYRRAEDLRAVIDQRSSTLKRVRISDSNVTKKRLKQLLGGVGIKGVVSFKSTWAANQEGN